MKEIRRNKKLVDLPAVGILSNHKNVDELWNKAISKSSPINFQDVFKGCAQITEIPKDLFKYNICLTNYTSIPSYWKGQIKDYDYSDWLKVKKHRCPNCGATKLIIADCEYCGT